MGLCLSLCLRLESVEGVASEERSGFRGDVKDGDFVCDLGLGFGVWEVRGLVAEWRVLV